uniref:Zinc finger protein 687b n=1 Tax=Hucho hucho TaxID=62062 RepID=A0A4W5JPP6_9TELE
MGDMKTPDFDDLLAAFDIPDIDAKEAIQSAPDEAEGPHGPGGAPLGKPDGGVGVGPSLRPPSPPDPQADTPIVSVIVKNRDTVDGIAGVAVGPRLGACAPGMAESEPLNHNGFGASGVTPPLTQAHTQSNGEPWSVCTPKTASEGPPLLIQEPPDSPARTPPKLARRFRSPAAISDSTHPMASLAAHPKPGDTPSGTSLTSSTPQSGSTKSPPQEDKHLEHVIEERDSPESPEPEIPKSAAPVTAKRYFGKEEGARTGEEKMEVDDGKSKPPTTEGGTSTPGGPAAPARPLKVRIKTIKTSTGGITRTVTRVAPKAGAAGAKGLDPSKAHPGGRKAPANRSRKPDTPSGHMAASQPQKVKSLNTLPVSTLAASSAMLVAATKAQNKMAASSDKTMVSATAVSFTKSAALPAAPSVASSPKFSVATGGMSVRPVGAKTANGGTASVLAGTHQPTKPASIVNSTGAVISRSQSSLVEAFNKILNSKNLLPSYKPDLSAPPPPEWGLPLPATGYRCLECGDAFALERSLARHYDRRSLRIEVTCNHCAKRLAFFNKCSLLLHAREHKERGLVMQCSHLVMRPVTVEQMIGQQDTTPIGKACLSEYPQALMPLPCKKGEVLQYHNFKCPECQAQFSGKAELVAHFQQIRATPNSTCTLCSPPMMLPNWCSVSAHQRIHKHRAPHVCPECGGIARQANFQTHLEEACLHFARRAPVARWCSGV